MSYYNAMRNNKWDALFTKYSQSSSICELWTTKWMAVSSFQAQ